jgi:hypothetical protein
MKAVVTYILYDSLIVACFVGQSSLIESTQGSCWLDTIVYITSHQSDNTTIARPEKKLVVYVVVSRRRCDWIGQSRVSRVSNLRR